MNLLSKFEAKQIAQLSQDKEFPEFRAGDSVKVMVKIVEGSTERLQAFEGVVLRRKHRGMGSTFTVKKTSHGESVERTFLLHSPRVDSLTVVKHGRVRRAKLYYMRELEGKSARITERMDYTTTGQRVAKGKTKAKVVVSNDADACALPTA